MLCQLNFLIRLKVKAPCCLGFFKFTLGFKFVTTTGLRFKLNLLEPF